MIGEGKIVTMTARRGFPLLVAASIAVLFVLGSVARAAVNCTDYWTGTGGTSDWATAANWTGGVPTAASNVCLDNSQKSGSYTVDIDTYNPALVANSITVGGSAGNVVTLAILGTGGGVQVGDTLTLADQDAGGGVLPTGAVTLGMAEGNGIGQPGAINVTAGTLVNQGTITAESTSEPGQNDAINGSFDNAGTLNVDQGFLSNFGTWTSSGTINIAGGDTLQLDQPSGATSSFTQTAGTIADIGNFEEQQGGTFIASGSGTTTGNPLLFDNVTVDLSGTGSGSFHIEGAGTLGSSIGSGYTLWASGIPGYTQGSLLQNSSETNYGTLELGSSDGTHGTLNVTGGTFTNAGTLVFENTANGPDGLNGALVNNGTVSVPNSVQGTGQITNGGSFSLTAGATFGATSYSQGPAGTFSLAITGGGQPVAPELQLTGAAALAGSLAVTTTGGTATGTFPVITAGSVTGRFAAPRFTGENYSPTYSATGVSLTGPASATSPPKPAVQVGKIAGGRGKLTVKVSCSTGSGSCGKASITATITERLKGKKITAISARATKVRRKTVVIARANATLAAATAGTVTLTLNRAGMSLLARFGKLKTTVTVTVAGKKLTSAVVIVQRTKKKRGKK